jgi:hypothetical protein
VEAFSRLGLPASRVPAGDTGVREASAVARLASGGDGVGPIGDGGCRRGGDGDRRSRAAVARSVPADGRHRRGAGDRMVHDSRT